MTTKEAIKHLSHKIAYWKDFLNFADDVSIEALELAVRALQKQEPMKVREHYRCPACGNDVVGSGYYCWNCGQHLKWKEKE